MPRKTVVAVVGPDSGSENLVTMAEELGRAIASRGYVLLTGGRSRGVMDAACKGAQVGDDSPVLDDATPATQSPTIAAWGHAWRPVHVCIAPSPPCTHSMRTRASCTVFLGS
jgi:hypothetical protein